MKRIFDKDVAYIVKFDGVIIGKAGKLMSQYISDDGYCKVPIYIRGCGQKIMSVHRLVAKEYLANPLNLPAINHKDEDKTNNHVSNLEWCTYATNKQHSSKLDWSQVHAIRDACTEGYRQEDIADYFLMSRGHISKIKLRRTWI